MHLIVGDHRFSPMDARRVVLHAADWLDAFPVAAHEHQGPRRKRIVAAAAGVDAMKADAAELQLPLEALWHELLTARDDVISARVLPASATGRAVRLSVSDGGVPKRAVDRVDVDFSGVVGDRQATRRHHGSPFQALCLWNAESIDELAALGHPIGYGDAGENVTMSGLDRSHVVPGVRLRLGTVVCEVSSYAWPCKQNAQWFTDGDFTRIHHENGPWSRMYATVLEPGAIATGDDVVLEPSDR